MLLPEIVMHNSPYSQQLPAAVPAEVAACTAVRTASLRFVAQILVYKVFIVVIIIILIVQIFILIFQLLLLQDNMQ